MFIKLDSLDQLRLKCGAPIEDRVRSSIGAPHFQPFIRLENHNMLEKKDLSDQFR